MMTKKTIAIETELDRPQDGDLWWKKKKRRKRDREGLLQESRYVPQEEQRDWEASWSVVWVQVNGSRAIRSGVDTVLQVRNCTVGGTVYSEPAAYSGSYSTGTILSSIGLYCNCTVIDLTCGSGAASQWQPNTKNKQTTNNKSPPQTQTKAEDAAQPSLLPGVPIDLQNRTKKPQKAEKKATLTQNSQSTTTPAGGSVDLFQWEGFCS